MSKYNVLIPISFKVNECNVNRYEKAHKHYLKSHIDDRNLSGPYLLNLSLQGAAKMRFNEEGRHERFSDILLPRRCLQIVTGLARWKWEHSIPLENFIDPVRTSITFRAPLFDKNNQKNDNCKSEKLEKFFK